MPAHFRADPGRFLGGQIPATQRAHPFIEFFDRRIGTDHQNVSAAAQEMPGLRLEDAEKVIRPDQRFILRTLRRGKLAFVALRGQFIHSRLDPRIRRQPGQRGRHLVIETLFDRRERFREDIEGGWHGHGRSGWTGFLLKVHSAREPVDGAAERAVHRRLAVRAAWRGLGG